MSSQCVDLTLCMREKVELNCFNVPCSNRRTSTRHSFLKWSTVVCFHKSDQKKNNRRHIHRTTKRCLGASDTRLSSHPGRQGETSEVDTERILWESVSAFVGGVESERVILGGDTSHRLAQGAVNMRKWSPFFTARRCRGGMKMHENSA